MTGGAVPPQEEREIYGGFLNDNKADNVTCSRVWLGKVFLAFVLVWFVCASGLLCALLCTFEERGSCETIMFSG